MLTRLYKQPLLSHYILLHQADFVKCPGQGNTVLPSMIRMVGCVEWNYIGQKNFDFQVISGKNRTFGALNDSLA